MYLMNKKLDEILVFAFANLLLLEMMIVEVLGQTLESNVILVVHHLDFDG